MRASEVIFLSFKGRSLLNQASSSTVLMCKIGMRVPCILAKATASELEAKQAYL